MWATGARQAAPRQACPIDFCLGPERGKGRGEEDRSEEPAEDPGRWSRRSTVGNGGGDAYPLPPRVMGGLGLNRGLLPLFALSFLGRHSFPGAGAQLKDPKMGLAKK